MHGVKRTRLTRDLKEAKIARDKIKIESYNKLQNIVLNKKAASIFDDKVLEQTTVLLDLNPEFYTIWNYRRDILVDIFSSSDKEAYTRELEFTMKQLLKFPKSYWVWNHRIWCLKYINDYDVYRKEMDIVNKMLARDERNFHGWAYRRFIVEAIEGFIDDDENLLSLSVDEFNYTTKMINKNISNYSAWHNRSKLIPKVFERQERATSKQFESKQQCLEKEIEYLINAIFIDSDDSSVWIYIRWVVTSEFFFGPTRNGALQKLKEAVVELNELEKDDNGKDNEWCTKTIKLFQSSSI